MSNLFIGIDPGKSGSVAFIDKTTGDAWSFKLDCTDRDIADGVRDALFTQDGGAADAFAVIEKVHSSPQMGVKSAFSFGQSFGKLEMVLNCLEVRFEYVAPAKWQGDMNCRTKGDKNITKAAAQRLFPALKITHANADALLLAEYARRKESAL